MEMSQQANCKKVSQKPSRQRRVLAALIFLMVFGLFGLFWAAGTNKVDVGQFFEPCGFKQRYGLPCPTCGMVTSTLAFAEGKIFESFYIQPAAAVLCSVLIATAITAFLIAVFGLDFAFVRQLLNAWRVKYVVLVLIIIIAGGWAVTLARALAVNNQP